MRSYTLSLLSIGSRRAVSNACSLYKQIQDKRNMNNTEEKANVNKRYLVELACVKINEDRSKQQCQPNNNVSTMSHLQPLGSIHQPSLPSILCFRMNSAVDDSNEVAQM